MDISFCDGNVCQSCSALCSCVTHWSQESFSPIEGRKEPANFDVDESAFCDTIQRLGRELQQPHAASAPGDDDEVEKWESPGAMHPPESSSPVFSADSSSPTWMSCRGGAAVDRGLFRDLMDDGIKASFDHLVDSKIPVLPTTPSPSRSHPHHADISLPLEGFLDQRPCAMNEQVRVDARVVCLVTNHSSPEELNDDEGRNHSEIDRVPASGNSLLALRKSTISAGPIILGSVLSNGRDSASSHGAENDKPNDPATTSNETRDDSVPSDMLLPRVSFTSGLCPPQAMMSNCLKRHRSSDNGFPESKRAKFNRTMSRLSGTSKSSVQSKYQAAEPASLRRAQSLKLEISTCLKRSIDSLFNPPPLSPLTSRSLPDKDYPPTVPSTPLPDFVDYARSMTNPLSRTLVVYDRRSLSVLAIPPVPIIAPPSLVQQTVVRCAEDHAIDRLEALLLRERSERERDAVHVHDKERTERLIDIYGIDLSSLRRDCDTESTSDSNDGWEEESTRSATESQESQEFARRVKNQILSEQHRLATRETWANAYGISNDLRKEITRWILEVVPKEPEPLPESARGNERPEGIDLYDQLMNSHQTRFHAAQLFHRYFLLPEKVRYCREARKYELFTPEFWYDLDSEKGVWDLAVACVALSVKLHRDCLWPLHPVFSTEFLEMAPYSMTHETFELAQRDILYSCQFQLGSCTPQDVLDELWNALPTLRKAAIPLGWAVVQRETWDRLFEVLLEPDMLQYPVTLLTAAALVDSLTLALACQYKTEEEANNCKCNSLARTPVSEVVLDGVEPVSWQIHLFEASQLVDDVILDVRDVLHLSPMELDECRMWLSRVGHE